MPLRVVADSACDLPPHIVEALGITLIPLHVTINSHDVSDTYADPARFWAAIERWGGRPRTAAPAPGAIVEQVRPFVEAGDDVLALTLTGKLSAVYDAFAIAAEHLGGKMHVFDTWSLSLGEGVQVMEAARLAQQGVPVGEIVAYLEDLRARVRLRAVLDTLDWAERGGRIAYLMPLIRRGARVFNVKVMLNVEEGRVRLLGIQRSYRRALEKLKALTRASAPVEHLLIPHTRQPRLAASLADEMANALGIPRESVIVQEAGPILAAHVGPGAVGIVVTEAPRQGRSVL